MNETIQPELDVNPEEYTRCVYETWKFVCESFQENYADEPSPMEAVALLQEFPYLKREDIRHTREVFREYMGYFYDILKTEIDNGTIREAEPEKDIETNKVGYINVVRTTLQLLNEFEKSWNLDSETAFSDIAGNTLFGNFVGFRTGLFTYLTNTGWEPTEEEKNLMLNREEA